MDLLEATNGLASVAILDVAETALAQMIAASDREGVDSIAYAIICASTASCSRVAAA